jgi:AcrR family transcriptional regulator
MDETRRGRPPGFDRAAALQAALHLFWAHGYDATTTRAITLAMDIEAPSLYAAFGSKRELFGQVVELYNRSYRGFMARALTEEPTLRAGLSRLLREAAAAYTQPGKPPGCLIIDAAVNCTCPDVAQMLAGLRNDSVNQLEKSSAAQLRAANSPPTPMPTRWRRTPALSCKAWPPRPATAPPVTNCKPQQRRPCRHGHGTAPRPNNAGPCAQPEKKSSSPL